MAESKERPADQQWAKAQDAHRTDFDRAKRPIPMRVAAFALWVVAITLEVAWILVVSGALHVPVLSDMTWLCVVVGVVGCLVLTLFGQRMWKKAGSIRAAKSQAAIGVVMASAGCALWALFFCASKNLPASSKVAGIVAAAVVIVAGVVVGNVL